MPTERSVARRPRCRAGNLTTLLHIRRLYGVGGLWLPAPIITLASTHPQSPPPPGQPTEPLQIGPSQMSGKKRQLYKTYRGQKVPKRNNNQLLFVKES